MPFESEGLGSILYWNRPNNFLGFPFSFSPFLKVTNPKDPNNFQNLNFRISNIEICQSLGTMAPSYSRNSMQVRGTAKKSKRHRMRYKFKVNEAAY